MKLGEWKWDRPTIAAGILIFGTLALLLWQSQINNTKRLNSNVLIFDQRGEPDKE